MAVDSTSKLIAADGEVVTLAGVHTRADLDGEVAR